MTVLLDTHALLWWLLDDPRLGAMARETIADPRHTVWVSGASGWEIATKHRLGKLGLEPWDPRDLPGILESERLEVLPVSVADGLEAGLLPGPHRDPFDRMLIAQSRLHDLPLVSRDPVFIDYGVSLIWD